MSKILNGKTHGLQRQRFCPSIHECWVKSLGEDCNLRGSITIGVIEIYIYGVQGDHLFCVGYNSISIP